MISIVQIFLHMMVMNSLTFLFHKLTLSLLKTRLACLDLLIPADVEDSEVLGNLFHTVDLSYLIFFFFFFKGSDSGDSGPELWVQDEDSNLPEFILEDTGYQHQPSIQYKAVTLESKLIKLLIYFLLMF